MVFDKLLMVTVHPNTWDDSHISLQLMEYKHIDFKQNLVSTFTFTGTIVIAQSICVGHYVRLSPQM